MKPKKNNRIEYSSFPNVINQTVEFIQSNEDCQYLHVEIYIFMFIASAWYIHKIPRTKKKFLHFSI
ncbi:hypothetical protein DERF_004357 [Dermatophagoides farinae]|uniref:Uncharacterized protein n=1 Tax=Dermatophagoides farinae TaxID=6954 RepID=A0A922L7M7_DERFA|nr:hypothetical protein DERF_004357 [Dermatophagoides farinae]